MQEYKEEHQPHGAVPVDFGGKVDGLTTKAAQSLASMIIQFSSNQLCSHEKSIWLT
jgi:hypothetical protein